MRVLRSLLLTALAFSLSLATPLPPSYTPSGEPLRFVKRHATELSQRALLSKLTSFLCDQPVLTKICSIIGQRIAPVKGTIVVTTTKGPVIGAELDRASRFTLRYGQARRFAEPMIMPDWRTPLNATILPPPCPQTFDPSAASTQEDCLYTNFFAPKQGNNLPVMVWLHGGSYVYGSSSAPGLDGSVFASTNQAVVVTLQYRLGMLGLLRADDAGVGGNMAVRDVILALSFIKSIVRSFGGNPETITLAGQSSGADMIRTLLSTPSADSLFQRAIIQSAPAAYADHSLTTANAVGSAFLSGTGCSDLACLRAKSVDEILAAQADLFFTAPNSIPGVSASTPFRPVVDGGFVRSNTFAAVNGANGGWTRKDRALLLTTVKNEAAPTIDGIAAQVVGGGPIPPPFFPPIVQELLMPASRSDPLLASGLYAPAPTSNDARDALTVLGTEYIWTCATQQIALNATATRQATRGIYLGQFDTGITYPSNAQVAYCTGKVCHEDDIYSTFGNVPPGVALSTAQRAISSEVLARWGAFVRSGSPNAPGLVNWPTVGTNPNVLVFDATNGKGRVATSQGVGCSSLWGRLVHFDAQLFGP